MRSYVYKPIHALFTLGSLFVFTHRAAKFFATALPQRDIKALRDVTYVTFSLYLFYRICEQTLFMYVTYCFFLEPLHNY